MELKSTIHYPLSTFYRNSLINPPAPPTKYPLDSIEYHHN